MENNNTTVVYTDEAMESAKNINRKFAVVSVCVFLSLILLPSIVWGILSLAAPGLVKKLDFDTGENRNKVKMPETIDISTLTSDLESYYNDRVPFRSVLYSLQKNMENGLEQPYTDHIVPYLSKLMYGNQTDKDQANKVEDSVNNPSLDLDNLFGDTDSSDVTSSDVTSSDVTSSEPEPELPPPPETEVEDEGDQECEHVLDKGTVTQKATCLVFGETTYQCTKCDYSKIEYSPKADHDDKVISKTDATCTTDGTQTVQCKNCKREKTSTISTKLGHQEYFSHTSLPSLDDYGYDLYKCKNCAMQWKKNIKNKLVDTSYLAPTLKGAAAKKTIIGRRDWLFFTGDGGINASNNCVDYYCGTNILSNSTMSSYLNTMKQLKAICDQKGIKLVFCVMPNKEQVYSEYMPTYQIVNSTKRCVTWRNYVKNNSTVPFVYPFEELTAYKQYFQTYYKHDTHWNTAGGFVGLQAIYKAIGLPTTDLRDLVWKDTLINGAYMWKNYGVGDLYGIGGLDSKDYADKYYDITYKPEVTVNEKVISTSNGRIWFTTSDSPNKQKIAVLSDSFKDAMAPFIPKDFASAMITHRSNFGRADVQAAVKDADVLVVAAVERYDTAIISCAQQCINLLR